MSQRRTLAGTLAICGGVIAGAMVALGWLADWIARSIVVP